MNEFVIIFVIVCLHELKLKFVDFFSGCGNRSQSKVKTHITDVKHSGSTCTLNYKLSLLYVFKITLKSCISTFLGRLQRVDLIIWVKCPSVRPSVCP